MTGPASERTFPSEHEPEPDALPGAGIEDISPAADRHVALHGRTLRQHTARGLLINSAFQVGLAGLGLLQKLVVAAFLTTSEFGLWGLLVTTFITIAFLKQVGIGDKYVQQDEPDQVKAFQKAFTLEFAYSLVFLVVIVIALPVYALIYGRPEIIVPGLVLSLGVIGSAMETPIWVAYRQMRFVRQRVLASVDPVTSTLVMVGLAVSGAGYWSLVIGAVAGTIAGGSVAVATCPYPLAWRFDRGTLREYFSFSWPLLLSNASSLVVVQGAIIIANYTVGLAGLGVLALASNFAMFADKVDGIIRTTIYPAVCAVRDRKALLFEAFTKSNRLALLWAVPFGAALALFAPDFIAYVLGEKWRAAAGLLQAFGLIIAARQIAFNYTVFFSAVGNTRPMAVIGAQQLVVFAVVTAPLMIWLGLDGYAIGVSVSVAVEIVMRGYFLSRLFEGFNILRHMARAIAPVIPPVVAVLALRLASWGERGSTEVVAELTLYVLGMAASLWIFERRLLTEMIGYLGRVRPRDAEPRAERVSTTAA
jgi:PST family polysaccharide transporter